MVRLPIPGSDDGNWGTLLNDFLTVEANTDGTLKIRTDGTLANLMHLTGDEGVAGVKTFAASPVVPTPTAATQVANKTYVDSVAVSGAPNATTSAPGLVQLAGDLAGTASSPSVAKIQGVAISGTPSSGQVITATDGTTASWQTPTSTTTPLTVATWEAGKGTGYIVSHRGSASVIPENTIESFDYAYNEGCQIAEVSVNMTGDGQLVVIHDSTYDRTTNMTGTIANMPSTVLNYVRVTNQPQLGPLYTGSVTGYPALRVPLFEDILRRYGGKMILMCEAKNDACYSQMVALIQKYGLQSSCMIKAYYTSSRIAQAKAAGFKVYGYFGGYADNTPTNVATCVSKGIDYLAIYGYSSGTTVITPSEIAQAVNASPSTMKVWAWPIQRRTERDYFVTNGCEGVVGDQVGYLMHNTAIATVDTWATKAIAPGELTADPSNNGNHMIWEGTNQMTLNVSSSGQDFICLGQMSPLAHMASSYTIDVDFQWETLPSDVTQNITICFANADDTYYQHTNGLTSGYHAIIRPDKRVQLFSHTTGSGSGTEVGTTGVMLSATAVAGTWYHAKVAVTPSTITFTVNDGTDHVVSSTNTTYRGGYVHIGKSSGVASFRNFAIT